MSLFLEIQHSILDLSQYSPPIQSSWAYSWAIPDDLSFDSRYGYQISFADGQNNTVASSPLFSAQGHSSVVPVSPSTAQRTTFSTSTIPASPGPTTDPAPTPSVGASPLPSPTDAGSSMGLSKVGGSKFILMRKKRRQRIEESPESSMLFWDKTPSTDVRLLARSAMGSTTDTLAIAVTPGVRRKSASGKVSIAVDNNQNDVLVAPNLYSG
ncbi:hypothetical protein LA080_007404 [Diaporthe eres]|nr:hypothetical protein LA080_007404 [Diaporthe eres]